jgi:hypothetical protein
MRVESSPRSLGRTPNGPLPTCVTFGAVARASPVDSGLACAIAAPVSESTCSGMRRISRSARAAVTLTALANEPSSSVIGRSMVASSVSSVMVRAASANDARATMTRYVPAPGVCTSNRPSAPDSPSTSCPEATDLTTTRAAGSGAPVGSVTRPRTVAADAGTAQAPRISNTTHTRVRMTSTPLRELARRPAPARAADGGLPIEQNQERAD